jgi:CHASE3 domain sensor protein
MTHDEYIEQIRLLEAEMREAIGEIQTLQLTPEEQKAVDALPQDKLDLMESIIAKYEAGPIDIRRDMVLKGIAIMLTKTGSVLQKAWTLGQKAGVSFG